MILAGSLLILCAFAVICVAFVTDIDCAIREQLEAARLDELWADEA